MTPPPRRRWRRLDAAAGGLAGDLALYAVGAGFAALTAAGSTLPPHRAWGSVAAWGYLAAAMAVVAQLVARRRAPETPVAGTRSRLLLTVAAWLATTLAPLLLQAAQRAAGRMGRAQEEVVVVEAGGRRLLEHGTPYLSADAVAALPPAEWLLSYLPYQPGMAVFGLPGGMAGPAWWADARIWFALSTAGALALVWRTVRQRPDTDAATADRHGADHHAADDHAADHDAAERAGAGQVTGDARLVRAIQAATVLPVAALTLATGGDDLPVLALCLLGLGLAARDRLGWAGVTVGLAGALKLFAWPVIVVLGGYALARRRGAARYAVGAVGLPLLAALPPAVVDARAMWDNVVGLPLGRALVESPARSPLPGYLIAQHLPGGPTLVRLLLLVAALSVAGWLVWRPPRSAAQAAAVCAWGLLLAILLMPATRFGYLLYPAAFAALSAALPEPPPPEPPPPVAALPEPPPPVAALPEPAPPREASWRPGSGPGVTPAGTV